MVHRSERADALVEGLARVLRVPPGDPFAADVVAVPSRGVERWISQSLASTLGAGSRGGDGVCAHVVFPSPSRLVRDALVAGSGIGADEDPWAEHRLPWPLLEVIEHCSSEDWCATLGRHLGLVDGHGDPGRRMAVGQKLAALFTSYGAQRPSMLRDWARGLDTDGYGDPLDPDLAWEAELWRRLRDHLAAESPAERLEGVCDRLRAEPGIVDLPDRLSLFGPTRLATDQLQVVDALAEGRDVHLWLPHPSHGLWRHLREFAENHTPAVGDAPVGTRRDDATADVPRHPLVRSLARDARELQLRLRAHVSASAGEHLASAVAEQSLLAALQRDIREDRPPTGDHELAPSDDSVQVHACHGRQRQVEVLREVLLGLLQNDPTLELRDIIVMCPDIESYAPLVAAGFGLDALDDEDGAEGAGDSPVQSKGQAHPGHRLTVRLADRSLRQTNPVLSVAARLLELADARLTASEVLDLAAMPPVRRRFRLDDDALERLGDWVRRSGVRWGLDAEARRPFGLERVRQNTWQAGLDRILVGVTMDEDDVRTLGLALPLDDVDSTEIDLAGRLAELVDRLGAAVAALSGEQPLEEWVGALAGCVDSLVDVAPGDTWQLTQARWQLTDALAAADEHATGALLRLSDVRELLAERLKGRPTRANFRTGHLTICTMVPMRSVPHRVVCLLGLDDGVFPRTTRVDGDDVLARHPRVGERDPRAEDRQLFLDALLAAKEKLVILYSGADARTGAERPPAVPLGELLDVLDATAVVPSGGARGREAAAESRRGVLLVRDRVVVRHPLQPFDPRNFVPGRLTGTRPFSFDPASFDGSRALLHDRRPQPPFLSTALPPDPEAGLVRLDDLVSFLEHPAKGFLRQRLGLSVAGDDDEPSDALPVAPEPLERWAIGDRLLRSALAGVPAGDAVRAEWLRGQLPPGRLGQAVVEPIFEDVVQLVDRSAGLRRGEPRSVDVALGLSSGESLVGSVPGVYGDRVVRVVYSKLAAKHRLRAWVYLLALAAQCSDRPCEAVTVGRGPKGGIATSYLHGVGAEDAAAYLDDLVEVYRLGLTRPLPLPPKTACSYAEKRRSGVAVAAAEAFAGRVWRSRSGTSELGEFADAEHQRVWGDVTMASFLHQSTAPGLADSAFPEEPHEFGRVSRRVWTPLLDAEETQP